MLLTKLLNNKNTPYYMWRLLYVAVKPLAILIAGRFLGGEVANLISLAIIISTTMMASLSFGTYKYIFKYKTGARNNYYQYLRRNVFIINMLAVSVISIALAFTAEVALYSVFFILLWVVVEHVIHDETRVLLYAGNRTEWARTNFLRSSFIFFIPVLCILFDSHYMSEMLISVAFINVLYSIRNRGLFYNIHTGMTIIFTKRFFNFYLNQINYFISSVLSKLSQQSDKYLYAMISYQSLWVYTIISQIATVAIMTFEMIHLSNLKSKIAHMNQLKFSFLSKKEFRDLIVASVFCITAYSISTLMILELSQVNYIVMFAVLLAFNFLGALVLANSERVFWSLSNPGKFMRIEMKSFFIGHILVVPFILFFNLVFLVKLPTIVSMLFKLREAKLCLKS